MNPMDLPSGMSPREELESRVIAMLLGEADDFEKTELGAILDKDPSLQVFHDEMARSIDVVGEATVSLGPVGGADAPTLSPSRRQELEQVWSGGTVSTKTTTMIGSLAKMPSLASLAVAAGVGLATGTVLVNLNNDENPVSSDVAVAEASTKTEPSRNAATESADIAEALAKRTVFDMPEGVASSPAAGQEGNEPLEAGIDLAGGKELLENELRSLASKGLVSDAANATTLGNNHLDLDRRTEEFKFDSQDIEEPQSEPNAATKEPRVFDLGPPNAPAVADDGPAVPNGFPLAPVPNAPSLLVSGGTENEKDLGQLAALDKPVSPGASALSTKPVATKKVKEKRELLAKHVTIATYKGEAFRLCRGRTSRCPENCGDSGEYATFAIEKYLVYEKPGKYGSSKQTSYRIQASDFHRKPVGDPETLKVISGLKEGDHVLLAWNHDYVTRKGVSSPDRPLKELRKLAPEEEKQHFPR